MDSRVVFLFSPGGAVVHSPGREPSLFYTSRKSLCCKVVTNQIRTTLHIRSVQPVTLINM